MRIRWFLSLLAMSPAASDAQDTRRQLEAADSALGAAWQARDLDGLMAFYHDSATAAWTDEPLYRGKARIRDFWVRTWGDSAFAILEGSRDVFVLSTSGDLAWMQGTSAYRRTVNGQVVRARGAWITVWRWIDGRWWIVRDGWNRLGSLP